MEHGRLCIYKIDEIKNVHPKQSEVVAVVGLRGYGKSVWTKKYIAPRPRVFLFDPVQDYKKEGFIYYNGSALLDFNDQQFYNYDNYNEFKHAISNPDDVDILAALSYQSTYNTLAIDEASFIFPARQRLPEFMRELVFLGRHRNINVVIAAQRAMSIPIDLRSQINRMVSFRQLEGSDIDWLREYFGNKVYEISELEKLHCFDSKDGALTKYSISP